MQAELECAATGWHPRRMADDSDPTTDTSVTDVPARQRFEARTADGGVAGFSAYERHGDTVVITHTEVDDGHEGQGVGGQLARVALDQLRTEGLRVDPRCPFVAGWIERHPDYQDLVA